ncbi:uncharacterized protein LOC118187609 [Stegodyphus dumicola]|uniref:uncharacterized protein LOC118187609 n=1 Tax=Stegodyphus dumicola TaxID=202533 RepID=UPI0015B12C04|nr:uncharacterized protein LOC118187609 [Stegodyphus dumicola]
MTRISRDTQIYTDGSTQEDGVGSAFAHYDKGRIIHVWKGRLDLNNIVFQAELQAIITAVDYIFNNNIERAKIFTDSMSTLLALDNHNHTSTLIINLHQSLQRNPQKHLSLTWIKAHAESEGNEASYSLPSQQPLIQKLKKITIRGPPSYLKGVLQVQGLNLWKEDWTHCTTGRRTYSYLPKVGTERNIAKAPLTAYITGQAHSRPTSIDIA